MGVFPGSHAAIARRVDEVGVAAAVQTLTSAAPGAGGPTQRVDALCRLADLAPPVQVLHERGAAVLAHYQTIHFSAPNVGPDPRVMVYFRVTRPPAAGRRRDPTATLATATLFDELPGLLAPGGPSSSAFRV